MHKDVVVIVPARISSTRLPAKPLQTIGDQTMIEHVLTRIKKIGIWNLFVATDSEEISSLVAKKGFMSIMTSKDCPTGTDRVYEAFKKLPDHSTINYIINVQGDMPFIDGEVISDIIEELKKNDFDIMTSVVKVKEEVAASPSNVKAVVGKNNKVLYFSRALVPNGSKEFFYHVGIYGFKVKALEKFVSLEQTLNEKLEQLEQLRALDNDMTIGVCYSNEIPISVDTEEDLKKAREFFDKSMV